MAWKHNSWHDVGWMQLDLLDTWRPGWTAWADSLIRRWHRKGR
jgi:hypothetical protein